MSSLFGIGGGGNVGASGSFYPYSIDQSLRFNDDDSAQLTRTPSSAGNRQTWTLSCWVKRSNLTGASTVIFSTANSSPGYTIVRFNSDNKLYFYNNTGNSQLFSDGIFRDTSAWYHIVAIQDSTNSTAADRMILYVNGEKIPQSYNATYGTLSLNFQGSVNNTVEHRFGMYNSAQYFDGYMAEVNFIDGTALDPTSFGETINGVWVPKRYSGSYGTNGFYLPFDDSAAIGDDESGNTNDWTANNLAASDVVPDSPTNNWATMNPLDQEQQGSNVNVYEEGNLDVKSQGNTGYGKTRATFAIPTSGKWYWEMRCTNTIGQSMGILNSSADLDNTNHFDAFSEGYSYRNDGKIKNNGTSATYGDSWTNLDNIGVLVDADAGEIFFYKNGTIQNSGTAAFTGLDMTNNFMPIWADRSTSGNGRAIFNFGQDSTFAGAISAGGNSDANGNGDFQYTVPTNALALCSANLPEPTISPNAAEQADDYFNTVLYTGNGSTQSITGVGFQPDLIWAKERSSTSGHTLLDVVRGVNLGLESNSAGAEEDYPTDAQTSFDADGFSLGSNGRINESSQTYVGWNWKAGGTAVSNTDGSITSQVSAAPDAGFSIVSYTGTGANATVGHGLNGADMVIVKNRDATDNWAVGTIPGNNFANHLQLNSTAAQTSAAAVFNGTNPTDTVFSIGTNHKTNASGEDYIAYCFHSVDGFSKVGSYVGNGNADGTFVFCNFRPAFLLTKMSTNGSQWTIIDNTRNTHNAVDKGLVANTSAAEVTGSSSATPFVDFTSNGFKIRSSQAQMNQSGDTFIYLAFAEAPFKYSRAR